MTPGIILFILIFCLLGLAIWSLLNAKHDPCIESYSDRYLMVQNKIYACKTLAYIESCSTYFHEVFYEEISDPFFDIGLETLREMMADRRMEIINGKP